MPLFNIFSSKQKNLKKDSKNPIIIADIHEKNSLVLAELNELKTEINLISLEVGDYLIGNTIVERKTISDFISSIISKRLLTQIQNMQRYDKKILILEGEDSNITNLHPNAIKGMILSLNLDYNIQVIKTKNPKETAEYLNVLAKRQLKKPTEISFHSRKASGKKEKISYILESFQNIGPKNAKKLLKKFKTIKNIINTPIEELKKEIGKKAEEFKIIEEEY